MALSIISLNKGLIARPLYNENSSYSVSFDDMRRYIARRIYSQIKITPELVSILDTVITDHFMGEVDLYDENGKPLGSTNKTKFQRFWEDNNVRSIFYGMAMDYFVDGSCFGWVATFENTPEYNSTIYKFKERIIDEIKTKEAIFGFGSYSNQLMKFLENEMNKPRKMAYLAASTTEILHNQDAIIGFKQQVNNRQIIWSTDQIVHIKQMEFNGEVRGFSAIKALVRDISLMYMIKENLIAKLDNGGSPDYIIAIKNANGTSRARFERLRVALESFSHLRKSHGNMPIDADVNAIPLGQNLKDMEYRDLAMFVISEFCLSLGVPTSRIPFMMTGSGGTTNKGELSGNSEDAYQKKINNRRTQWEIEWNKIFRKAGFTFKFRRDNLQDNVRETQASTQRASYVLQVQTSLKNIGKQLTLEAQLEMLSGKKIDLEEEDVEDLDMTLPGNAPQGLGNPGQNKSFSNTDLKSTVSQDRSDAKKNTASNNGVYV